MVRRISTKVISEINEDVTNIDVDPVSLGRGKARKPRVSKSLQAVIEAEEHKGEASLVVKGDKKIKRDKKKLKDKPVEAEVDTIDADVPVKPLSRKRVRLVKVKKEAVTEDVIDIVQKATIPDSRHKPFLFV